MRATRKQNDQIFYYMVGAMYLMVVISVFFGFSFEDQDYDN